MCLECYREWQYDDDEYYEEYCHRCGKSNDTTLEKPLCLFGITNGLRWQTQ